MRRTVLVLVLSAGVAGLIYYLSMWLEVSPAAWVSIITSLTVLFVGIIIFLENRNPSSTVAWILALSVIPVVGILFYFLFGQNYWKRRKFGQGSGRNAQAYAEWESAASGSFHLPRHLSAQFTEGQKRLLRLAHRVAPSPVSFSSRTRILTNGSETFHAILHRLEQAVHHIHMEYYIFRNDEIGNRIKEILVRKAKEGVEVRFLYDAVGSMKLPFSFLKELTEAGVRTASFSPVSFFPWTGAVNYRNHRKIIVIDGRIGFIGGLNVGDEYLGRNEFYGFWRDTHMSVEGEAVGALQMIFLQDWQSMTGEALQKSGYLPADSRFGGGDGAVQIVASGPDHKWETVKHLFFSMIVSARESIWIATPYFIPDEDLFTALQVAALSGVDVRLLFPKRPDKWLPYLASHSYFLSLLEAGVKIYEYEKGFMHAKILIVDGNMASIGSANMDMRSFHLNFEVNAFLYGTRSTRKLVSDFLQDLRHSSLLDAECYRQKNLRRRFMESAARLFSPLL